MKKLLSATAVAVFTLCWITSPQAQTVGQAGMGSTIIEQNAGAPKQGKLPPCNRARKAAGTPCR
jgi:hypothetical protein